MTTDTHDTAAALEAAIRTFGVCAYSPSEPSDPYGIAGAHIWIEIEDYAAPLKAAITAHVEAEVARRLEAAPGVDLAIVRTVTAVHDHGVAAARCSRPEFGLARLEARADDAKREESALRAAIAADKARAVEAATRYTRPAVSAEAAAQLVARFEESIGHEMRRRIGDDRAALLAALTGKDQT